MRFPFIKVVCEEHCCGGINQDLGPAGGRDGAGLPDFDFSCRCGGATFRALIALRASSEGVVLEDESPQPATIAIKSAVDVHKGARAISRLAQL
jgi:hypothetical protein